MKKLTTLLLALLLTTGFSIAQTTTPLKVGDEIDDALKTGETDVFTLTIDADQFVFGYADQKTVDVVITVKGPDGTPVASFDSPARGHENFQFNTEDAGQYTFEITPFEEEEGDYSLLVSHVEPVAKEPAARVDQLMMQYSGNDVPGAAALVIKDGEVIFQKSYGMANLTHNVPMQENTLHNIGSTSKQFLTFGLLLLEEEGKLDLDDDVRKYIPELPEFDHVVTLRNLVNHTSGYREFLNLLAMTGRNPSSSLSQEQVIEIVQRQPELQNVPGAEWNYNNTGYVIMTEVIERISDMSFPQWMKENVFEPIGMNHTVSRSDPGEVIENRSQGYQPSEDGGVAEVSDLGGGMGPGSIHTTLGDLSKWINNLQDPKVGTEAMVEEMTTSFELNDGNKTGYGLGFFMAKYKGLDYFHHGGADLAHRSMFMVFPEIDAAVVTQSNHASFNGSIPNQIAEAFFDEYMEADSAEADEEMAAEEKEEFEYDPADFDPLTGRYELEVMPGFILSFSRDDDRIYTQATGQPEVDITATSDSTFSLVGVNASVTFHRNEDYTADSLTLHQNGNHIAKKIKFEVTVNEMEEFTGRYFSEEIETVYDIAIEDSSLMLKNYQLADDIKLSPGSVDTFSAGYPIAEVDFVRNEAGEITGFNASNGRTRNVYFKKWSDK
jgi:CubicO group peptidase (beta-lactamase class C family)